jgi:hypothetical protein
MRAARRGNGTTHSIRSLGLFYAAAALKNLLATCIISTVDDSQAVLKWFNDYGLAEQYAPPLVTSHSLVQSMPLDPFFAHKYNWGTWEDDFVGRSGELKVLQDWMRSPDPMMIIQAIGGQGKTALSWYWFNLPARFDLPQLMGRFWWSFYDSDSSDILNFASSALSYISGHPVNAFSKLSRAKIEEMLINALRSQPYLLVLDGFERLMHGYNVYDAARKSDEEVEDRAKTPLEFYHARTCIQPEDREFLRLLCRIQPSKILITTRLIPADLQHPDFPDELLRGVNTIRLQGLDSDAVLHYMQDRGVKGDPDRIKAFMEHFGNHGLVMKIVTSRICAYRSGQYIFERWFDAYKDQIDLHSPEFKQRRNHTLAFAFRDLEDEHRQFLRNISAFSTSVNFAAIAFVFFNMFATRYLDLPPNVPTEKVLETLEDDLRKLEIERFRLKQRNSKRATDSLVQVEQEIRELERRLAEFRKNIKQLKDVTYIAGYPPRVEEAIERAVDALEDRGLLLSSPSEDLYDLHPIVREFASTELTGESRKHAYKLTIDYFEQWSRRLPEQITDLQLLMPLQGQFIGLIEIDALVDAAKLYREKLAIRLHYDFEAYAKITELLSPLFKDGLEELPAGIGSYNHSIANCMANALDSLGRKPQTQKLRLAMINDALAKTLVSDICIEIAD